MPQVARIRWDTSLNLGHHPWWIPGLPTAPLDTFKNLEILKGCSLKQAGQVRPSVRGPGKIEWSSPLYGSFINMTSSYLIACIRIIYINREMLSTPESVYLQYFRCSGVFCNSIV